MSKSKKSKHKTDRANPHLTSRTSAVRHAAKLALDFTKVHGHIEKSKKSHTRLPQAIKKLIKAGIQSAVEVSLSRGVFAPSLSKKDVKAFQDLILTHISTTVPSEMATSSPESNIQDKGDQGSGDGGRKERENGIVPTDPLDPTAFAITLGISTAPDDHQFCIRFNNKRVVDCLNSMPSNEIWQLVYDAIQHDSKIPSLSSSLPRVTDVCQQDDGRLALSFRTSEDLLHTLSTNAQWVGTLRDTVSSGIQTFKVVVEFAKTLTIKMETHAERVLIVEEIREENSDRIPSLSQIGAIRDITILPDQVSDASLDRSRADHAYYVIVFGSRQAANIAMDIGLLYRQESRNAIVYGPNKQWHRQCSRCQEHGHTATDCQSAVTCGRCGYKHATRYCTSATVECANCHGKHAALSKKCNIWLKAEDEARRSYRFPEETDSGPYTPTPAPTKPASHTLPSPELPQSKPRKSTESPCKKLKHAPTPTTKAATNMPSPGIKSENQNMVTKTSSHPSTTIRPPAIRAQSEHTAIKPHQPRSPSPGPSALLRTIDEFRAFVAAREANPDPRKPKESEYVMTGALQTEETHEGKRVKREEDDEEGSVWPVGHKGYRPHYLKLAESE